MRWAYKHASGFVSVCRFAKEILTSLGVPPDRVEVIPPTLSLVKRSKTRLAAVPDHRILSVGRLIARKGFNYLIDAIRLLRTDIPDIHLTIVGNGQERESLLRKILDAHLEHQVSMRTNVPDEELAELYQECDVFVLANVMLDNGDCEGSPTVLIEASSCGKPVIGGASGGTDTMIEDGKTGYLVDPRDTRVLARRLKEILSDSSLAFQMGMAGIQKVETQHRPHDASIRFHAFIQRIVANA
jgi:glycosyltransferase involved in cell wall biosynthesis